MKGWRLQVRHHTGYRYASDVHASYNEARLTPPDTENQLVIEHRVEVHPGAVLSAVPRLLGHLGPRVRPPPAPPRAGRDRALGGRDRDAHRVRRTTSWPGATCAPNPCGTRWCELLGNTSYTAVDDELLGIAEPFAGAPTPRAAIEQVVGWIGDTMEYEKGSTTVATTAPEAFQARHGVCQDFAHLGLALVRSLGIPCRYTSGYLHPSDEAPGRRDHVGREPRLDRGVARGVDAVRPDQRRRGRRAPRRGRARARLRRRAAAQGRVPRWSSEALDVNVELTRLA